MAYIYKAVAGRPLEEFIARLDNVQWEVDSRAVEIADRGENLLRDHRVEGIAHIELAKGDIDSYVVLTDSEITNDESSEANSALSIEFGREGWIDEDGNTWGEMKGLHILTTAANLPKKGGRKVKKQKARRDRPRRSRFGKFIGGED